MSGSFTVGAIAASSREANSVGAVRLTLLPKRLEVELLKSGSYADGYVPGPLTRFVRISAPYTAIRGLVRRGDGVLLSFDSRVVTPHNRFFLTHFSDAPLESLAAAYRTRRALGALAWLAPIPIAIAIALRAPEELVSGALGRAAVVVLGALATGALLRVALRWSMRGGPISEQLLATLERRLSQRLGFDPALFHETDVAEVPDLDVQARAGVAPYVPSPQPGPADVGVELAPGIDAASAAPPPGMRLVPPLPSPSMDVGPAPVPPAPLRIVQPPRAVPRSSAPWLRAGLALGAMLTVTSAAALVAVRVIPRTESEVDEPTVARAGLEVVDVPPDEILERPTLPLCTCERADSPLWRGGVPVLSVIPVAKHVGEAGPSVISPQLSRRGRGKYDFDLAIVNNANESLSDIKLVVTFARRNEQGQRVGATDRGLFWEGKLRPGASVKWGVKGPGTELKIELDERRMLEGPTAPADAFAKLLRSDKLPVTLHGATMLAYLGDERGKSHVLNLTNLAPPEASTRARILRASEPLKVCNVVKKPEEEGGALSLCAWNGTKEKLWNLSVAEVDGDGLGRTVALPEPIPKGAGLVLETTAFEGEPEELVLVRAK